VPLDDGHIGLGGGAASQSFSGERERVSIGAGAAGLEAKDRAVSREGREQLAIGGESFLARLLVHESIRICRLLLFNLHATSVN
jgi:hypothetical protein